MTTVLSNPDITDDERRTRLNSGQVLVYPASPHSLALIEHARNLIVEAFGSKDPQTAQQRREPVQSAEPVDTDIPSCPR